MANTGTPAARRFATNKPLAVSMATGIGTPQSRPWMASSSSSWVKPDASSAIRARARRVPVSSTIAMS